jgi:hypothetical protein
MRETVMAISPLAQSYTSLPSRLNSHQCWLGQYTSSDRLVVTRCCALMILPG